MSSHRPPFDFGARAEEFWSLFLWFPPAAPPVSGLRFLDKGGWELEALWGLEDPCWLFG